MSTPNNAKFVDRTTYRKWSRRIALVVGVLFLPLLWMALASLGKGLEILGTERATPQEVLEPLIGGIVGLIVALGIPGGFYTVMARSWPYVRAKQQHPNEPWMWRSDWAERKIPYSRMRDAMGLWIGWIVLLTLVLVLAPVFAGYAAEIGFSSRWLYGVAAILLVWILIRVFYETWRWRKFGTSYCHLVQNPGVLGGWLRINLEIPVALKPGDAVQMTLKLVFRSARGKREKGRKAVVWQIDRTIPYDAMEVRENRASFIPADFFIPKQVSVDMDSGSWGSHEWRLEASAQLMGIDYAAEFAVPIFATEDSLEDIPSEAIELFGDAVDMSKKFHAPEHIRITPAQAGIEIREAAMGTSKYVVLVCILGAVAAGSAVVLGMDDLGAPTKVIALIVSIPVMAGLALTLFYRRVVTLTPEAVVRIRRFLFYKREKVVPIEDVREVWIEATQRPSGGEHYRVDIKTKNSPPTVAPDAPPSDKVQVHWTINIGGITVADSIADKNQALWLKKLIESYLFPKSGGSTSPP